jgi:hypothetical protein
MISITVKKYFRAFASLLAMTLILVMALTALAEVQQPGGTPLPVRTRPPEGK